MELTPCNITAMRYNQPHSKLKKKTADRLQHFEDTQKRKPCMNSSYSLVIISLIKKTCANSVNFYYPVDPIVSNSYFTPM